MSSNLRRNALSDSIWHQGKLIEVEVSNYKSIHNHKVNAILENRGIFQVMKGLNIRLNKCTRL